MDAFEQLVSEILKHKGYWVQTSFKVALSKEEKDRIKRPSSPRWEIDILAYKGATNELLVVECKSFFDSRGVTLESMELDSPTPSKSHYKLFSEKILRETVFSRLRRQLAESGSCQLEGEVTLALACGKFASGNNHAAVSKEFDRRGWKLFDIKWLEEGLLEMSRGSYENQVSSVTSKILGRAKAAAINPQSPSPPPAPEIPTASSSAAQQRRR